MPASLRVALLVALVSVAPRLGAFSALDLAAEELRPSRLQLEIWPRLAGSTEPLAAAGYFVRLDTYPNFSPQLVFPAGLPFKPPAGRYAVFVEGPGWISPQVHVLSAPAAKPLETSVTKKIGLTVAPAGVVKLAPRVAVAAGQHLRFLGLDSHNHAAAPMVELCRRIFDPAAARAGVQMPAGETLLTVASADNSLQAISRPFRVEAGKTIEVEPLPPAAGVGTVFSVLEIPGVLSSFEQYGTTATLSGSGQNYQPKVVAPSSGRVYLVFYDLPPGAYSLELSSKLFHHAAIPVRVMGGKIERVDVELEPNPRLEVHLDVPAALAGERQLVAAVGPQVLRQERLTAEQKKVEWTYLPPAEIEVVLDVGPWRFSRSVDLRGGDQEVFFAPEALTVAGRVQKGELPLPAKLTFSTDLQRQIPAEVSSDAEGNYEAILWRAGTYLVQVLPQGEEASSWTIPLTRVVEVENSAWQRLDFLLPANDFRVVVRRSDDQRPIAGAEVSVGIEEEKGGTLSLSGVASSLGEVRLPPLEAGHFVIAASAEGYLPAESPRQEVRENSGEPVVLELEPIGERLKVVLTLPSGEPAQGAEARLVDAIGATMWQGNADARGELLLPKRLLEANCWLLARHPHSGALVRGISGAPLEPTARWRFPAARALEIEVDPHSLGRWTLASISGGLRLFGPQAAWLLRLDSPFLKPGQIVAAPGFSEQIEALGAFSMAAAAGFFRGELDAQLNFAPHANQLLRLPGIP